MAKKDVNKKQDNMPVIADNPDGMPRLNYQERAVGVGESQSFRMT